MHPKQYTNRVIASRLAEGRSRQCEYSGEIPETPMTAEINIPPILKIGGGSFAEASALLFRLQCKRPLIVTDPFLMKNQLAERLRTQIQDAGLSCEIFHETVADPTTVVVEAGVRVFVDGGHDSLVSLGGGSPIDTAKAIGMLAANGGKVRDYRVPRPIPAAGPVHLAIPTTAGTGSEVTTVHRDHGFGERREDAACREQPVARGRVGGLRADDDDAAQAYRGYRHRLPDPRNRGVCQPQGEPVHRRVRAGGDEDNLGRTANQLSRTGNVKAREAMMLAATQAGIAFSNASVALVHGMSRPLGAHFHIPHGLSNAMLLPAVTAFSVEAALDRYAECARAMGLRRRKTLINWPPISSFTVCTRGTPNCRYLRLSSSV